MFPVDINLVNTYLPFCNYCCKSAALTAYNEDQPFCCTLCIQSLSALPEHVGFKYLQFFNSFQLLTNKPYIVLILTYTRTFHFLNQGTSGLTTSNCVSLLDRCIVSCYIQSLEIGHFLLKPFYVSDSLFDILDNILPRN